MTVFSFNIRELPTYDKDLPFNIKDNGWGCIVWVLNLGKKKKKKSGQQDLKQVWSLLASSDSDDGMGGVACDL